MPSWGSRCTNSPLASALRRRSTASARPVRARARLGFTRSTTETSVRDTYQFGALAEHLMHDVVEHLYFGLTTGEPPLGCARSDRPAMAANWTQAAHPSARSARSSIWSAGIDGRSREPSSTASSCVNLSTSA